VKVLLVILHAEASRGGAERYTRDLVRALVFRGLDVVTAAAGFDTDWPGGRRELHAPGLTRAGAFGSFLDALDTLRVTERFDVVHAMLPVRARGGCDFYHPHAGIAAVAKHKGPLEHLNRRRRLMATTERDLLTGPRPPVTLALSGYVLGHFRSVYPDAPAEVLLNGVDTAVFDPGKFASHREHIRGRWGVTPGELAVLCVAQDFERKGVPTAVRALAKLGDLPVKLVVVGRDDPGPVSRLARSLGVEARVVLPGPMPDVRPAYAGADLFVLPTHHDPCPLVTVEALAMGLPVVSTVFNGATEWMSPPAEGRVLPAVDETLLAGALRELSDPAVRSAAREACLALRPRLDAVTHIDRLVTLYKALAR
jgi:UDP-glucose:(heptosyl)LPS alpha-1,3-glucosyltransferase